MASECNGVPELSQPHSQTPQTIPSSLTQTPLANGEVIHPSLDKYGRLIQSRTGEKVYVGSSSMTLFGLEIQNMVPSFVSSSLLLNTSSSTTPAPSPSSSDQTLPPPSTQQQQLHQLPNNSSPKQEHYQEKRIQDFREEGNAYKITLSKPKRDQDCRLTLNYRRTLMRCYWLIHLSITMTDAFIFSMKG